METMPATDQHLMVSEIIQKSRAAKDEKAAYAAVKDIFQGKGYLALRTLSAEASARNAYAELRRFHKTRKLAADWITDRRGYMEANERLRKDISELNDDVKWRDGRLRALTGALMFQFSVIDGLVRNPFYALLMWWTGRESFLDKVRADVTRIVSDTNSEGRENV